MGYCTLNKKCNWNEKRQIYLIGCKVQFWNSQLIFRIIAINLRLLWLLLLLMSEAPPRPVQWMVVYLCRIRSWGSILLLRFLSAPRFLRLVDDEGDLCGTVCWYLKVYTQKHPLECFAPLHCLSFGSIESQHLIINIKFIIIWTSYCEGRPPYIYIIIVPTSYNNIIRRCLLIITTTMTIATSHKQQQQPNKEFCKAMCIISHVRIITILLYCLMYPIQSPSLLLLMMIVMWALPAIEPRQLTYGYLLNACTHLHHLWQLLEITL